MRIFEIIKEDHETMKFVDDSGTEYEVLPFGLAGEGWTVWSGTSEWKFENHAQFVDFLDQYNLKPVSTKLKAVREKKSNAWELTGSGRADPQGKKGGKDSAVHRAVRTPDTTYSKTRKKYNHGAKPGARDGFVG